MATYYTQEAWQAYSHLIGDGPQQSRDIVRERCAKLLGVDSAASRKEITAAFRLRVKEVHPDFGGSPDEFQKLIAARNTMLVKCSRY